MAPFRVLVVEDNREVRRMISASINTLSDEIEVLDVMSAEEALVINASSSLDLIILDINLPGMSGLDMVTRLRKRKPGAKIFLITGIGDPVTRQRIVDMGVEAYFFKPIEISSFLDAVKDCLWPSANTLENLSASSGPSTRISPPTRPVVRASPPAQAPTTPDLVTTQLTLLELLSNLKKQVKAVAVLLVNGAGQVVEEAGTASEIATGSPLLNALMHAFRASLQVSHAMARGNSESLQYFVAPRQCIYVTPIGMEHVLFVVTVGYFGPDKLGTIYHAIHLSVRDIQALLEAEAANHKEKANKPDELPAEIVVDKETLAGVENMFSQSSDAGAQVHVDTYWDSTGEKDSPDGADGKDILTYQQARDLGLAPDDDQAA